VADAMRGHAPLQVPHAAEVAAAEAERVRRCPDDAAEEAVPMRFCEDEWGLRVGEGNESAALCASQESRRQCEVGLRKSPGGCREIARDCELVKFASSWKVGRSID
jgi:hypothetical protein